MINSKKWVDNQPINYPIKINSIPGSIFWSVWEIIDSNLGIELSNDWQFFTLRDDYFANI
jgi:hypothetical protein